jgi:hypothetical protein
MLKAFFHSLATNADADAYAELRRHKRSSRRGLISHEPSSKQTQSVKRDSGPGGARTEVINPLSPRKHLPSCRTNPFFPQFFLPLEPYSRDRRTGKLIPPGRKQIGMRTKRNTKGRNFIDAHRRLFCRNERLWVDTRRPPAAEYDRADWTLVSQTSPRSIYFCHGYNRAGRARQRRPARPVILRKIDRPDRVA